MIQSNIILTEKQRGILQVSLEIGRDKFADNWRHLRENCASEAAGRLILQFQEQEEIAEALLNQVTLADNIIIQEEAE